MRSRLIKSIIVVTFGILAFGILALLRMRRNHTQIQIQETRLRLINVARASTNFFYTLQYWPTSLVELISEKERRRFLFIGAEGRDAFGSGIEYESFNGALGYGTVKTESRSRTKRLANGPIIVRFTTTNVYEVP